MKKHFITLVFSLFVNLVLAQEYKINKANGKLMISLSAVTVEGYEGKQIIFSSLTKDARARGLHAINGSAYTDNTGLGISVVEKGSTVEVNQVAYNDLNIKILVPKNVILSFVGHAIATAGPVKFRNLQNEIEISADHNPVSLENVSGPIIVRTLYEPIEVKLTSPIKGPISIVSIYSTVELSVPVDIKANVKLSSSHGELLAAPEIKIVRDSAAPGSLTELNGKINGGGIDIKLSSAYGQIYLRRSP
ncbi:hypothetical protein BEL04_03560 [Mucilaginibacter sp. PPCGB 2223]|uniref:hypothetical protein n=1 Tax=Mucilaginibacter sp. PPCGB 2223 TaxID=1886027 RepID=UPI000826127C|nr:hypothetical protein [Mucilaginibacter sp. PPCGB 2223]OCX53390.1 hypothetical protein BEL04_03560 [Mucilaginibacter sp. PPCGB 2223]